MSRYNYDPKTDKNGNEYVPYSPVADPSKLKEAILSKGNGKHVVPVPDEKCGFPDYSGLTDLEDDRIDGSIAPVTDCERWGEGETESITDDDLLWLRLVRRKNIPAERFTQYVDKKISRESFKAGFAVGKLLLDCETPSRYMFQRVAKDKAAFEVLLAMVAEVDRYELGGFYYSNKGLIKQLSYFVGNSFMSMWERCYGKGIKNEYKEYREQKVGICYDWRYWGSSQTEIWDYINGIPLTTSDGKVFVCPDNCDAGSHMSELSKIAFFRFMVDIISNRLYCPGYHCHRNGHAPSDISEDGTTRHYDADTVKCLPGPIHNKVHVPSKGWEWVKAAEARKALCEKWGVTFVPCDKLSARKTVYRPI